MNRLEAIAKRLEAAEKTIQPEKLWSDMRLLLEVAKAAVWRESRGHDDTCDTPRGLGKCTCGHDALERALAPLLADEGGEK